MTALTCELLILFSETPGKWANRENTSSLINALTCELLNKPMRIAQVVSTFPPYQGGIGNVAYHHAQELAGLRHKVVVFTPFYPGPLGQLPQGTQAQAQVVPKSFQIHYLRPFLKYGNAAFLPQLFWCLRGFDLVELHYPAFGLGEVIWLARKFQIIKKLILYYHMDVVSSRWLGLFFRFHTHFLMPLILNSVDKILVSSFDYASSSNLKTLFKVNPAKFLELSHGVELNRFYPQAKDEELLKRYKLKPDDKIILFVGGLDKAHYFKGVEYLIRAFHLLLTSNFLLLTSRLVIIGSGNLKPRYMALVERLNLSKVVIFTGRVPNQDLAKYYNLADVLVLPSRDRSEAFGLVLVEAMACGKAVIASNLAGVRTVVEDGKNGFLVEPGNIKDLAQKIKDLLLDYERAKRFGEAGRKKVEEKYNWAKIGRELNEIVRECAK